MNATEQKELKALFSPEDWAWLNTQGIFTCITDYHVAQLIGRKLVAGRDHPVRDEPLPADLEVPEAELDMAFDELKGPNTKMDAQERIARLTRHITYLQQVVAHAMEIAFLDGHNLGDPDANDAAYLSLRN